MPAVFDGQLESEKSSQAETAPGECCQLGDRGKALRGIFRDLPTEQMIRMTCSLGGCASLSASAGTRELHDAHRPCVRDSMSDSCRVGLQDRAAKAVGHRIYDAGPFSLRATRLNQSLEPVRDA